MPSSEVFSKWKRHQLHSGSKHGPEVTNQKQAVAIYLSEKRAEQAHGGKYPERAAGGSVDYDRAATDEAYRDSVLSDPNLSSQVDQRYGLGQYAPAPRSSGLDPQAAPSPSGFKEPGGSIDRFGNVHGMASGGPLDIRTKVKQPPEKAHRSFMWDDMPDQDPQVAQAHDLYHAGGVVPHRQFGGPMGVMPGNGMRVPGMPMPPTQMGAPAMNMMQGMQPQGMPMPNGIAPMMRDGGGGVGDFNVGKTAHLNPSYMEKSEMRSVMHGPILSSVPGRTDAHKGQVPAGSYVVPADIVSGRGQGNTLAGMNSLQQLFKMGPYGTSPGAIRPGHSMPQPMRAPKPMAQPKMQFAAGGGKQGPSGQMVPVNLAGGELVVPPQNLMDVVNPDLDVAHSIMDAWVLNERKNLRKTLANLPGPAQD